MEKPVIKVEKKKPSVLLPCYESEGASGLDLHASLETDVVVPSLGRVKIPTGLMIEIPSGFEGQVRPRSGLAINSGITVLNSPGTIDSDYRGEVEVILVNLSADEVCIKNGQRIAQLVITQVSQAILKETNELSKTARKNGGFGSTGV